ncbi:retrovirus-related pol polyprotein from transposon TNT 1-94 [Tanacetum coccineum]
MTGAKSYLHKYVEQLGPKVVFGDISSYITEGYGSINCGGIVFTKVAFVNGLKYNLISISQLYDAKYIVQFNDEQGIIFNANKEIILIAPRRNDVYVLYMSSLTPNRVFFFAKASESVNWLWHKRLSNLNFKNINKLAKQNKVLYLPSLVYSKDKPCTTCEKGKHHRASFKIKQNFSIRKCLHLLHMDLFRPVNHACMFSLLERLKADNTIRVNQIVTIFLIKLSIHLLDQNRYPLSTSLIHIESCKSPTAELFDVDSGRISIRHYETKEYHFECSGKISRIMRRTLVTTCEFNGVQSSVF